MACTKRAPLSVFERIESGLLQIQTASLKMARSYSSSSRFAKLLYAPCLASSVFKFLPAEESLGLGWLLVGPEIGTEKLL